MGSHERLRTGLAAALLWSLAACNSGPKVEGTEAGTTGSTTSGSSGGSSTGAASGTTSAGVRSSGSSGSMTGGSSTGAAFATTGTGTGGTTGGVPCGPGSICIGENCVMVSCVWNDGFGCPLPDGGSGFCEDGVCWVPGGQPEFDSCNSPGASCPSGSHCGVFGCVTDAGVTLDKCDQLNCPAGTVCGNPSDEWEPACLTTVCQPGHDYDVCAPDSGIKITNSVVLDIELCCGSICADLGSDPSNCGSCGIACAPGQVCLPRFWSSPNEGSCYPVSCDGQPSGTACALDGGIGTCCGESCVDLRTNSANCGVCGIACPTDAGYACDETVCLLYPDGGSTPYYCDQIYAPCPAGWTCIDQLECVPDCSWAPAGTQCGNSLTNICCGGQCVDLALDPANCGTCGQPCPQGEACNQGFCQTTDCTKAGGVFTPCVLPSGAGGECCGGGCSDELTDDSNCGVCGQVCPTGSACLGGQCLMPNLDAGVPNCVVLGCPAGSICPGPTVDGDCLKANCGPYDDNNRTCVVDGGIEGPLGTCCGGRCVDKYFDSQNCGICGLQCGEGTTCIEQLCGPPPGPDCGGDAGQCAPGFSCVYSGCLSNTCAGLYNGEPCFGGTCCEQQCVDTQTDPNNLGGCGMSIAISPGGNPQCSVCIDFSSNPQNCGKCGFACAPGQTCVDGGCNGS